MIARRFGWIVSGAAALAGCVQLDDPPTSETSADVTSGWQCTTSCSCRYPDFTFMETAVYSSTTSTPSASTTLAQCTNECEDGWRGPAPGVMVGPTTCTAIGGGSGSGSGSSK